MNIDPADFFTGYEMYNDVFCNLRRPPRQSLCRTICIQLLVIIATISLCGAAFYYYQNMSYFMKNYDEEDPLNTSASFSSEYVHVPKELSGCEIKFRELNAEIKSLKDEMESTNVWRQHLDGLFTNIYLQQDASFEKKIEKALNIYTADRIGLYDYAALYAGGAVLATPDTVAYPTNRSLSFLSLVNVEVLSSPETVLETCTLPGCCYAFRGRTGRVRVKLGRSVVVRSVTLDHVAVELVGDVSSAPKDFEVYGLANAYDNHGVLLGKFTYNIKEESPYQNFKIKNDAATELQFVELNILNNYGKSEFTCVYRFRVHNDTLENFRSNQRGAHNKCKGGCE